MAKPRSRTRARNRHKRALVKLRQIPPGVAGVAAVQSCAVPQFYRLRLFVTGMTRTSARAIERVRAVCDTHLTQRYELEVVDIFQLPSRAREEQIIATPTLIKAYPLPLRRYIGDLSNIERFLFDLDLPRISNDTNVQ